MRKTILTATLAALLAASPSPAAPPAGGAPAVELAWTKAVLAGDLEAVVALYGPDAVLWTIEEKEARGIEAIRASYAALLSANVIQSVVFSHTGHRTSGSWSAGWGNFSLTLAPKAGGAPITMTGRFTEVVEKKNGRWRYVVDHASADPAPAPSSK